MLHSYSSRCSKYFPLSVTILKYSVTIFNLQINLKELRISFKKNMEPIVYLQLDNIEIFGDNF